VATAAAVNARTERREESGVFTARSYHWSGAGRQAFRCVLGLGGGRIVSVLTKGQHMTVGIDQVELLHAVEAHGKIADWAAFLLEGRVKSGDVFGIEVVDGLRMRAVDVGRLGD